MLIWIAWSRMHGIASATGGIISSTTVPVLSTAVSLIYGRMISAHTRAKNVMFCAKYYFFPAPKFYKSPNTHLELGLYFPWSQTYLGSIKISISCNPKARDLHKLQPKSKTWSISANSLGRCVTTRVEPISKSSSGGGNSTIYP